MAPSLTALWLFPPLAIARIGPSDTPCPNYRWGPNDVRPDGTGKTTLIPEETLSVDGDGTVRADTPTEVHFKDEAGFRPVCPFFELHGTWEEAGVTCHGPISRELLARAGFSPRDVRWTVTVANLKGFHYTQAAGDRVTATIALCGDDTQRHALRGTAPPQAANPLVPEGYAIPLGSVQITRLTDDFRDCRLRFTPPAGLVYGPTDFNDRVAAIVKQMPDSRWRKPRGKPGEQPFELPPARLFLNRQAAWPQFVDNGPPFVTNPAVTFAFDDAVAAAHGGFPSLGLLDDMSDGVVECSLGGLTAAARIVVGPPDYAPDRRPFVSIADGLTDRVRPDDVHDPAFVHRHALTTMEVGDLLERVFEVQGLINLDALNDRALDMNRGMARDLGLPPDALKDKMFVTPISLRDRQLPLTEYARQRHRRFLSLEVLEDRLREDPSLLDRFVRPPFAAELFHDQRMPPGMQGSDTRPLHISRRQFDLLQVWAQELRRHVKDE